MCLFNAFQFATQFISLYDVSSRGPIATISERPHMFFMEADNYYSSKEGELFSFQREIALHLKNSTPSDFYLSGANWDMENLTPDPQVPSAQGVMSEHQFSFCFEATSEIKGLVSQKLLDAIYQGTIPIYFSTGHDRGLVPSDMYINAANFDGVQDVIRYCTMMSVQEKQKLWKSCRRRDGGKAATSFQDGLPS